MMERVRTVTVPAIQDVFVLQAVIYVLMISVQVVKSSRQLVHRVSQRHLL